MKCDIPTFKSRRRSVLLALGGMLVAGCIENDIPYPYVEGYISDIAVEEMEGEATINRTKRTVTIEVGEDAIMSKLQITKLVTNSGATFVPDSANCLNVSQFPTSSFSSLSDLPANANTRVNANNVFSLLIQTYQDYPWLIYFNQTIERSIEVENQMGEAQFDASTHTAIVYVESGQDLSGVNITSMKLESANATISPDPTTVHDFRRPQQFTCTLNGEEISIWTIDVQYSETVATTGSALVRPHRATLKGSMKSGTTPTVEYREQGTTSWTTLPSDSVTINSSVSFTARVGGLTESTTYEWRIGVDDSYSSTATFTTETIPTVPNLNFDTWTQSSNGRNWYANPVADNYDDPQAYWASGNEGVTSTLAGNREATTQPVEGSAAYSGYAARMESITGVSLVGAAAGNLFIGYYKTNLTAPSQSPSFGRAFSGAHPDGLRGYYKYTSSEITYGTYPGTLTTDQGHIYMRIWDEDDNEIAYGEHVITEDATTYTPFEFRLTWTSETAEPAKMTIVATSSRYGGDFEGSKVIGQVGDGSVLWIDEFEIIYD